MDFDNIDYTDPLLGEAASLIFKEQVASTSLLQRRMKLGYNRAGRIMDQLESAGIVGPSAGSASRMILVDSPAHLQNKLSELGIDAPMGFSRGNAPMPVTDSVKNQQSWAYIICCRKPGSFLFHHPSYLCRLLKSTRQGRRAYA